MSKSYFQLLAMLYCATTCILSACRKEDNAEITPPPPHQGARELDIAQIYIETPVDTALITKDNYTKNCPILIYNKNGGIEYQGITSIKGRGNSTFKLYPKKPYSLKLEVKKDLFGGGAKSKKWTLLAEYTDKSFLRTAFMLELSKILAIDHTVSYDFVDLYLNGGYNGLYILTEKIENAEGRIEIEDDGFIIENDAWYAEEPLFFTTDINNYHFTFKYPDSDGDIVSGDDNYVYISKLMNSFEMALYSDNYIDDKNGYKAYADVASFAKFYIAMELLGNMDPNWYYVVRTRGSKIEAYPLWDAEWSLGLADTKPYGGWAYHYGTPMPFDKIVHNGGYIGRMLEDPYFKEVVKYEWSKARNRIPTMLDKLKDVQQSISLAAPKNFTRWKTLGTYIMVGLVTFDTWEEESQFVFDYFNQRMEWFDQYIENL